MNLTNSTLFTNGLVKNELIHTDTVFYAFYLLRKNESMFSSINLTSLVNQTIKL